MNRLEIAKECFFIRGEVQNGSITGVNSDEQSQMYKYINREMRYLASLKPPYLNSTWKLKIKPSVVLSSSGTASATASKNIPRITDTGSNLKKRDIHRIIDDGDYQYTLLSITGTTMYNLSEHVSQDITTSTTVTAYKKHIPLPHDVGDITTIEIEDSDRPVVIVSRDRFNQADDIRVTYSDPDVVAKDVFSMKWGTEKFTESGVTTAQNSHIVTVSDGNDYDIGDVLEVNDQTSVYLHTLIGVSTTTNQVYLDRDWTSTTTNADVRCNPKEYTRYLSFLGYPTTEKTYIVKGYVKPQDLVRDDDECIFPEDMVPAIIIGALLRDDVGKEFVTDSWRAYYQQVVTYLKSNDQDNQGPRAGIPAPGSFYGRRRRASEFTWGKNTGIS